MKRNAEKLPESGGDQDSGIVIVEGSDQSNGAVAKAEAPVVHHARPEVVVLGWAARSNRLASRRK